MVEEKEESTKDLINDIVNDVNSSKDKNKYSVTLNTKMDIPCIKSGSISLDKATGNGFPLGRIVELFGKESNGKSSLAESVAGECQKAGGIVIYIDTEYALTPDRAADFGIDWNQLIRAQPNTVESVFSFMETVIKSINSHKTNKPILIVWDSVAATPSKAELEGDYDDQQPATKARAMSKGFSKIVGLLSKTNACLICINQERENVGVLFGSKKTTPGGKALKFYSSIRMEVTKTGMIPDKNNPKGISVKVKCTKNKVASPFKEAEFNIMFSKPGIDKYSDLLDYGKSIGMFGKTKGWYTIQGKKMRKAEAIINFKKNEDLYNEYYEKAWNGELDEPQEESNQEEDDD